MFDNISYRIAFFNKNNNACIGFNLWLLKIGINVNHHHATSGMSYRVFDIFASNALLITSFQEESDLTKLFGEDHKILTYRTLAELRQKVQYYLDHDDERKELVDYCNQLVEKGVSFKERATQIIQTARPNFVPYVNKLGKRRISQSQNSIPGAYNISNG